LSCSGAADFLAAFLEPRFLDAFLGAGFFPIIQIHPFLNSSSKKLLISIL
jgi:hypothetical protein